MVRTTKLFFIYFGLLTVSFLILTVSFAAPYGDRLNSFLALEVFAAGLAATAAVLHGLWVLIKDHNKRRGALLLAGGLGLSFGVAAIVFLLANRSERYERASKPAELQVQRDRPVQAPSIWIPDPREAFDRMLQDNPNFKPLVWPPPTPSAFANIPTALFGKEPALADVAKLLAEALGKTGYTKLAYFYAPFGFAVVTGIEQIKEDGTPLDSDRRWFAEPAVDFSIADYLQLLLKAPVGRYRALIFVVTSSGYSGNKRGSIAFERELYFHCLSIARRDSQNLWHIYPDDRSSKVLKENEFSTMLSRGMVKGGAKRIWPTRRLNYCDSRDVQAIQVSDVICGAIAYRLNGHYNDPNANKDRRLLSDYVLDRFKIRAAVEQKKDKGFGPLILWFREHIDKPVSRHPTPA